MKKNMKEFVFYCASLSGERQLSVGVVTDVPFPRPSTLTCSSNDNTCVDAQFPLCPLLALISIIE